MAQKASTGRDEEEGDGDLGLQGMSMDDSSPRQGAQATFGGSLYKLLGGGSGGDGNGGTRGGEGVRSAGEAVIVAHQSESGAHSSGSGVLGGRVKAVVDGDASVHSTHRSVHRTNDDLVRDRRTEVKDDAAGTVWTSRKVERSPPKGKERAIDEASSSREGDEVDNRASFSDAKRKEKDERRLQRRISRLHNDIAGPVAERPLAGTSDGPTITPRRASAVYTSSKKYSTSSPNPSATRRESLPTTNGAGSGRSSDTPARKASISTSGSSNQSQQHVTFAPNEQGQRGLGIGVQENRQQAIGVIGGPTVNKAAHASHPPSSFVDMALPSTNQEIDVQTTSMLDIRSLQRWVLSVGCVNFDLDKGPDLEFLYPSLGISREERDNIAFSSFPDTSIFDDGSAIFSWRVREVPLDSSDNEAPVIASPLPIIAAKNNINPADRPKSASPPIVETTTSGTWSRKGRLFGGFERARANLNRSSSTDDTNDDDVSHAAHAQDASAGDSTRADEGGKETLSVPIRRDSVTSTPSSVSTEHHSRLSSEAHIQRSITPVILGEQGHLAVASSSTSPRRHSSTSANYIHGYCFFRQKRDAKIRRGYFQKSIVILSHLPYVSLFSELVRRLGPLFFENGMPVLEAFCHDIQNWPTPEPGAKMHLPLLGSVISVELPFHSFSQTSLHGDTASLQPLQSQSLALKNVSTDARTIRKTDGSREAEPILASIPSTPLLDVFRASIEDMWLLWECLLLAEPMLVVGPDPTACSEAVWHMLNLIKPIPFAGDFRPFFTIHDYDFRTLVTKNKPSAGVILGVTNPFMLQACKHWPHVLKVGRSAVKRSGHIRKSSTTESGVAGGVAGGHSAGGGGPEHTPGLVTKRKRRISKDRTLIKQLLDAIEGKNEGGAGSLTVEQANEAMSKYFADQTERFLAPLNRYLSSLIPAEFDLDSPYETPNIKPFSSTAFLASLKQHGTPLPLKSRNLPTGAAIRQSLYVDFIHCPNFSLWLHSRIRQSQEEQYVRKLTALTTGNVATFASTKGEVESMELYARLNVEIEGINERLIAGRKERELEPNSRWKSPLMSDKRATQFTTTTLTADEQQQQQQQRRRPSQPETADVAKQSLVDVEEGTTTTTPNSVPASPVMRRNSSLSFGPLSLSSSSTTPPLNRLSALPPTRSSAVWIRQTLSEPGWMRSFTHFERNLLIRKAGLIEQLDRLLSNLPDDLRQTLQLKHRQRKP